MSNRTKKWAGERTLLFHAPLFWLMIIGKKKKTLTILCQKWQLPGTKVQRCRLLYTNSFETALIFCHQTHPLGLQLQVCRQPLYSVIYGKERKGYVQQNMPIFILRLCMKQSEPQTESCIFKKKSHNHDKSSRVLFFHCSQFPSFLLLKSLKVCAIFSAISSLENY